MDLPFYFWISFSSKVSFLAFYCFSIISFKTKPKSDRSFIIESRLRFLRWHAAVFLIRFDFDSDPAMWFQSPGFWSLFRGKVSDLYGSGLGSATLLCSHARAFLYSLRSFWSLLILIRIRNSALQLCARKSVFASEYSKCTLCRCFIFICIHKR